MRRTLRNPFKIHVKLQTNRFDTFPPPRTIWMLRRLTCVQAFLQTQVVRLFWSCRITNGNGFFQIYLFGKSICPRFVFLRDFKGREAHTHTHIHMTGPDYAVMSNLLNTHPLSNAKNCRESMSPLSRLGRERERGQRRENERKTGTGTEARVVTKT